MKRIYWISIILLAWIFAQCQAGDGNTKYQQAYERLRQEYTLERVSREKIEVTWDDLCGMDTPFTKHVPIQACYHPDVVFVHPDMSITMGGYIAEASPNSKSMHWSVCLGLALGEPARLVDMYAVTRRLRKGYLPIVESQWTDGPIKLMQTAFTFLPNDKEVTSGRETQYFVMRLQLTNTAETSQNTALFLPIGRKSESLDSLFRGGGYGAFTAPMDRWQEEVLPIKAEDGALTLGDKSLLVYKSEPEAATSLHTELDDFKNVLRFDIALEPGQTQTIELVGSATPALYPKEEMLRMRAVDVDKSLAATEEYWQLQLSPAMKLTTPESRLNDIYKAVILSSLANMSKNPDFPWIEPYQSPWLPWVWPWEFAHMAIPMMSIGYQRHMEPALEFFTQRQNEIGPHSANIKAPGDVATIRGSYSAKGVDWMNDTGSVLWVMAMKYHYDRDETWLRANRPSMLVAWDWIQLQRAATRMHKDDGEKIEYYGLMPGGRVDDAPGKWYHFCFSDNYLWKGMAEMAAAFQDANLPEADRLAYEADEYKQCILDVMRGQEYIDPETNLLFVPSTVGWRQGNRGAWWQANGLVQMFGTGLLSPTDERFAPMVEYVRRKYGILLGLAESFGHPFWYTNQVERIYHKCYLARGEYEKALLTFYSAAVYGMSNDCYQTVERNNMEDGNYAPFQPNSSGNGRLIDMLRRMVIDEQEPGNLWLLRGCPSRWFAPGKEIVVTDAPTLFGKMAVRTKSNEKTIVVDIDAPDREPPDEIRLVVRHPDRKPPTGVTVNGKEAQVDDDVIVLRKPIGRFKIVCIY